MHFIDLGWEQLIITIAIIVGLCSKFFKTDRSKVVDEELEDELRRRAGTDYRDYDGDDFYG